MIGSSDSLECLLTPKTARTRWSGLVCVLYARLIRMCAIVGHGFHFKTLYSVFSTTKETRQAHEHTDLTKKSEKCSFLLQSPTVSSYTQVCGISGNKKKWLPRWPECPIMTHGHMHYKACEMHPILKPVMLQNNTDHCQINRQTSFNENSLCCLQKGEPSQSQPRRGRSLGHVFEVWGDLLQQLP